jgi:hypothetical protein
LNTKVTYFVFILWLIQFSNTVIAQSTFQLGGLPSLNFNKKLKNDWSLNSKIESRLLFQQGKINGDVDKNFNYVLTDFSLIGAKKIGLNSRIAGGYLIRLEDGSFYHRFIQQYVIVQKLSQLRLAHRFLTDQTISAIEEPEFRLRYRITSEIPLDGESVDNGEFYLKINNEYINSLQAREYDLEIRFVPLIGFDISERFKIETGLDYRVNSFLTNNTRHSYWMTWNLFVEM